MHVLNLMAVYASSSNLVNFFDATGIIIGIIGALGAAGAVFYKSYISSTLALRKAQNEAQKDEITRLEAEAIKSKARETALELRIDAYKKLPDYSKVSRQITSQHKEVMLLLGNVAKTLVTKK